MPSDLTAGLILLAVYVRCAPVVIRRRPPTPPAPCIGPDNPFPKGMALFKSRASAFRDGERVIERSEKQMA